MKYFLIWDGDICEYINKEELKNHLIDIFNDGYDLNNIKIVKGEEVKFDIDIINII